MFKNEYLLDMDLKFVPSFTPPRFRRGDTAILKFRIHDNGIAFDSSQYDKAEITIEMPSKVELVDFGKKEKVNGADLITFQFAPIHMVEVGIYTIYLTLIKGEDRVSTTPIKVRFYDNLSQDDLSFISIIEDLQKEINQMQLMFAEGINMAELGAPNGVAKLDQSKKVLDSQIPDYINEHIATYMRSDNGAHGFRITANGVALYKDKEGAWNNVIFEDTPVGGGLSPHTPPNISINDGVVTIVFPDRDIPAIQKWDAGERDVPWFQSNGYPFAGSGFSVTQEGNYTLYYKLQDGREFVVVFAVTKEQLPIIIEQEKPIKDIPKGTVVKIDEYYWQVLEPSTGFLWFADEYPIRLSTGYDDDMPRENRTRNFAVNKTSHAAYILNNNFYNLLSEEFQNAIKTTTWNNGDDSNESAYTVSAKIGLFTMSDFLNYKSILKYIKLESWEKWSYTMTKDSTDELSIFAYIDDAKGQARLEKFDVFQYYNSDGVNNVADARPVVYVDPNFEVPYEDESEAGLEAIENFNDGDIVKFGGYNWILLDKASRKLVMRDPVKTGGFDKADTQYPIFDPTNKDNIAYWLNNEFYNSIPTRDKSKIVAASWDTRFDSSVANKISPVVEARVGLMTLADIEDKRGVLSHFNKSMNTWLLTFGGTQYSGTAMTISPEEDNYSYIVNWRLDSQFNVNPVVHLSAGTMVSRVQFSNVSVSTLSIGDYANIGGYEWVHMGDGVFAKSRVFHEGSFAGLGDTDKTFNLSTGIGKSLSDMKYMLYYRDRSKLKTVSVLTGKPTDNKIVYTDIYAIHYNDWINGYKDIAMKYFRDDYPYWLMNNGNRDTLAFIYDRASTEGEFLRQTSADGINYYRPVIKLDLTTNVEIENNIDKDGFAYIPDVELRKILNKILNKGEENNSKIKVQEMYSITSFDTFYLGKVKDLTGIELLVNCTSFKASLSLEDDQYNKVNFTDIEPLISLGRSKRLATFELYSISNSIENTILNQLKGKFPNIIDGNVRDGNNAIWIDTWELKGVPNRPQILRQYTGYAHYLGYGDDDPERDMYSIDLRVVDNSADIVKWKPAYSDTYIPWTHQGHPNGEVSTIPKNTIGRAYTQKIFKYDETTPDGKWTIGFENANGKRAEISIIVKDHIVYWQYDNEQEITYASILSGAKFPTTGTYTVPTVIDGLNVVEIGNEDNPRLDSGISFYCEKVVIPEQIRVIHSFMPVQRADIEVYVHNKDCKFLKPNRTFISTYKDGTFEFANITVYGKPNSTTKKLMESRAQQIYYTYREF